MNLNDLKPTWQQFKLLNSMCPMDQAEIMMLLERAEGRSKTTRLLIHAVMFLVITFFFQGG